MNKLLFSLFLISFNLFAHENYVETISKLPGLKYPDGIEETGEPILTYALYKRKDLGGFNELIPFLMPSPNQEDAGSCLYMSTTGIVEWWLNYLTPSEDRTMDGNHDLSERYLMNVAGEEEDESPVKNWKTDTIYLFNHFGAVLNDEYPYTKGWYKEVDDKRVIAEPEENGSEFGTGYNWISEIEQVNPPKIDLPKFEREIIFADPENNQWNTGVTPENIVEKVKEALRVNHAPVSVIYNHYGYWHAHFIVGFDDKEDSGGCKFTKETAPYLLDKAKKWLDEAEKETDQRAKEKLIKKAGSYTKYGQAINKTMDEIGCGKGVFYVRDSLYSDPEGINYSYHTESPKDDRFYVKRVILREYEYLRALANHIIQIRPVL